MSEYRSVLPQFGFGTWQRTGDEAVTCIHKALETGYRAIDTAERYGNEADVGRALATSGVPRGDIFVTSKVWWDHFQAQDMRDAIRRSLDALRLDALDLYLIHWPSPGGEVAVEDYMERIFALQAEGLTTHVGICNHPVALLDRVVKTAAGRPIATHQVEVHPFLQNRRVAEASHAAGIPLTAYLPLARGAVADDPVLMRIAAEHGATSAQVALAFLLAEGHAVIPSSSKPARIVENFGATKVRLTADDMAAIRALERGERFTKVAFAPDWDR